MKEVQVVACFRDEACQENTRRYSICYARHDALINKKWTLGHEKLDTKFEYLKTPSLTEP